MNNTSITEEERGTWGRVREGEIIWSPGKTREKMGFDEGCTSTPGEGDPAVVGKVGEAVKGIEEGAGNEVVDSGPLEGTSNALELFG